MEQEPIFCPYEFGTREREVLDRDGHFMLLGIITSSTCERLTESLTLFQPMRESRDERVRFFSFYAAEYDTYLASLIAHPQMLDLARRYHVVRAETHRGRWPHEPLLKGRLQ